MPRKPQPIPDLSEIPDVRTLWSERLPRVLATNRRTETVGMTRPPRPKAKRAVLERKGQLGPFTESRRSTPRSPRRRTRP